MKIKFSSVKIVVDTPDEILSRAEKILNNVKSQYNITTYDESGYNPGNSTFQQCKLEIVEQLKSYAMFAEQDLEWLLNNSPETTEPVEGEILRDLGPGRPKQRQHPYSVHPAYWATLYELGYALALLEVFALLAAEKDDRRGLHKLLSEFFVRGHGTRAQNKRWDKARADKAARMEEPLKLAAEKWTSGDPADHVKMAKDLAGRFHMPKDEIMSDGRYKDLARKLGRLRGAHKKKMK